MAESSLTYAHLRRTILALPMRVRLLLGLLFLLLLSFVTFQHSQNPTPPQRARDFHASTQEPPRKSILDDDWGKVHKDWQARPDVKAALLAGAGYTDYGRAAEMVEEYGAEIKAGEGKLRGKIGGDAKEEITPITNQKPKAVPPIIPPAVVSELKKADAASSVSPSKDSKPTLPPASTDKSSSSSTPSAWSHTSHIFAFGDSWSYTQFDIGGVQPSLTNPFGNPSLPSDGTTSPPEWLHYLTLTYNATFTRTYNLAHGAAPIDRACVRPHENLAFTSTFTEQVQDLWRVVYGPHPPSAKWNADDTLFAIWFGVVDLSLAFDRDEYTEELLNVKTIAAYSANLETLYDSGARRFLLLNVPPLDLAPGAPDDSAKRAMLKTAVDTFNTALLTLAHTLRSSHIDITLQLFDANALLTSLMQNPSSMEQTKNIQNTTQNCWNYNPDGVPSTSRWERYDEECGVSFDAYFWANQLHVTHVVQEGIAAGVVRDCFGRDGDGKGEKGFCEG